MQINLNKTGKVAWSINGKAVRNMRFGLLSLMQKITFIDEGRELGIWKKKDFYDTHV
jgi:hypothetical protein